MDNAQDLIERLCVAAGMIMEDEAELALRPSASASQQVRLERLAQAGGDISAMAAAVAVIVSRWPNSSF